MFMKDNVFSVLLELFSSMVYAPEDVELTSYMLTEFVFVKLDSLEKEKIVYQMLDHLVEVENTTGMETAGHALMEPQLDLIWNLAIVITELFGMDHQMYASLDVLMFNIGIIMQTDAYADLDGEDMEINVFNVQMVQAQIIDRNVYVLMDTAIFLGQILVHLTAEMAIFSTINANNAQLDLIHQMINLHAFVEQTIVLIGKLEHVNL